MSHHHHPGSHHPAASPGVSILRMSAVQRLAIAVAALVVIWLCVAAAVQ